MISHRDLQVLAGLADYFPLVGDYLRGATTEVQYETDRGDQFRTHIIVEATSFPVVMIAVEGSDSAAVARSFFALPLMYQAGGWDVVDPSDERALRELIDRRRIDTEAAQQAGRAELARRLRLREEEELQAALIATEAARQEACERLLTVIRPVFRDHRWRNIVRDLNLLIDAIEREGDRRFIADVSRNGLFSDRQFAWVMDIFDRTIRSIRKKRSR